MDSYTMTPADMRAVTDGARDDGFGMGGGWMWIIVLFLFLFGFGGGGAWSNRGHGLTQMEMQQGFDTQETKNVYDAAALIIVRDAMRASSAPSAQQDAGEKARRDAIMLTAHSADLDKVPTLAEVEDALGAVVVNTPEERERANRVKTWAEIIGKP